MLTVTNLHDRNQAFACTDYPEVVSPGCIWIAASVSRHSLNSKDTESAMCADGELRNAFLRTLKTQLQCGMPMA